MASNLTLQNKNDLDEQKNALNLLLKMKREALLSDLASNTQINQIHVLVFSLVLKSLILCLRLYLVSVFHLDVFRKTLLKSRYPRYAVWPRAGACHANHACAALTVSRCVD